MTHNLSDALTIICILRKYLAFGAGLVVATLNGDDNGEDGLKMKLWPIVMAASPTT